jgi:sulfur carrier protein
MINLIINGEEKSYEKEKSISQIITALEIEGKVMAAAVNMEVVKKDNWNNFKPKDGDKIEFLQFVGGG